MYLHMDLTEKDNEGAYWQTKLKEKIEWRDNFFSQFRELLPPTKLKELEKQEQQNQTAKRLQTEKDTAALRGNAAIRYMMQAKTGDLNHMIKDGHKNKDDKKKG